MDGKEIKKLLIDQDLSQKELALRIGIKLPYLNAVINGHRKTTWIQKAIARELKVNFEHLFPGKNQDQAHRSPIRKARKE